MFVCVKNEHLIFPSMSSSVPGSKCITQYIKTLRLNITYFSHDFDVQDSLSDLVLLNTTFGYIVIMQGLFLHFGILFVLR